MATLSTSKAQSVSQAGQLLFSGQSAIEQRVAQGKQSGVARAQAARRVGQKRIVAPPAVEADDPFPQVEDLAVAMGRRCRTHSGLVMPAR